MNSDQLDLWPDEVAVLPWGGQSPRAMAQLLICVKIPALSWAACGVDKSVVGCPSREAQRFGTDPAQLQVCICTPLVVEL